ncbi:transcription factor ORG2-like [Prosopis cineraria]|uniref:transcription factor ORG2-like n=1 Tax=Prosopis cineraria TaxID=364024 RepID=UPI00241041C7|nr:transcription factor ORG2-like [Prosopis cineraria]
MLALSPSLLAPIEWALEEPTSHNDQNLFYKDGSATLQFSCSPPDHQVQAEAEEVQRSTPVSLAVSGDPTMVKKLNHNATERDRRKKINSLYSSLCSMLPLTDQPKKLSIPATISRVLKYIPELQRQVEGLVKKKEELLLRISPVGDAACQESRRKMAHRCAATSCVVSTRRLNDNEAVIQISSDKLHRTPFSEILLCLEKEGLLPLNASTIATSGQRIFYNLHLQMDETCRIELEILSENLLSIYEKEGNFQCFSIS